MTRPRESFCNSTWTTMHTLDAEALYRTLFAQLIDAYGPSLGAPDGIAVVGIYSGGAWLAERLAADLMRVHQGGGRVEEADLSAPDPDLAQAGAALTDAARGLSPATGAGSAAASGAPAYAAAPDKAVRHGVVNVSLHRDDFASKGLHGQSSPTHLPFDIAGRRILLLDDVVHTGRTIRAAINELYDYGRPASVELGVLVDRGARELPIAARFAATRVTLEAAQSLVMTRDAAGGFGFDLARRPA
ncbi:MAG: bifunctional pyr operon transcriptional regulator/uracil phosphoribosyltransferase PyrR [Janthinobacterium lividum]